MTSDNKNRPAMSHFATMDDYREALAKHEAATAEQSSTPVPPAGGDTKCPRGCTGPDEGGSGCAAVTGECSMSAPAVPEGVDTAELRALLTEWHAGYQYGPATRFDRAQKSIIGLLAQQREAGRREGWTDGGQILQAAGKIEAALATRCDQGLATRQPDLPPDFLMPEDAWNEYAIRSGLLNECGVAPDPAKTQTAYFAYQAAWNRLHAAFSAYIATRQPVSQTDHDLLKLTLEQTQELLRQADEAIAKRDATALRVATCAGEFARDAARCQPVSAPDDNDRLKSCPHCGGHAEIDQSESGGYYIECLVCGASTQLIFATGDDPVPLLMERWNKRIRPAEPVSALTDEQIVSVLASLGTDAEKSRYEDNPVLQVRTTVPGIRNIFAALLAASPAKVEPTGRMATEQRRWIEGMSVSLDVSTGEHDADHRYYGVVSEVMDCDGDKHGVTLLVYDAKPNFEPVSDDKRDAERLEFLMEYSAYIAWGKVGERCRVFVRDEDGDASPYLGWKSAWSDCPREAIDNCIAATPPQHQPETK